MTKKTTTDSQKREIANYLLLGLSLTSIEAVRKFGCTKLSTRIGEMEREGLLPHVYRKRVLINTRYNKKVSIIQYSINKNG